MAWFRGKGWGGCPGCCQRTRPGRPTRTRTPAATGKSTLVEGSGMFSNRSTPRSSSIRIQLERSSSTSAVKMNRTAPDSGPPDSGSSDSDSDSGSSSCPSEDTSGASRMSGIGCPGIAGDCEARSCISVAVSSSTGGPGVTSLERMASQSSLFNSTAATSAKPIPQPTRTITPSPLPLAPSACLFCRVCCGTAVALRPGGSLVRLPGSGEELRVRTTSLARG